MCKGYIYARFVTVCLVILTEFSGSVFSPSPVRCIKYFYYFCGWDFFALSRPALLRNFDRKIRGAYREKQKRWDGKIRPTVGK